MNFKPSTSSNQQQKNNSHHPYELLNNIPLIKAPGTSLPKPIVLPADLHPMPDDITAYFVYPYTLESSSLNYLSSLKSHPENLQINFESAKSYLRQRDQIKLNEKEQLEKQIELTKLETLKKLAPGWNGQMDSIVSSTSTSLPTKMPRVKESEASSEAKARTDLVRGIDPRYSSALRITSDQSLGKILSEA